MYSGDPPPSFTPAGITRFNQEQQTMGPQNSQLWQHHQIQTADDDYSQPPSQGDMRHHQGNSNNQFQEIATYRGLDQIQTGHVIVDTKAPSFSGLGHGQGNSYNQDPNISRGLDGTGGSYVLSNSGGPLSVGAMVKGHVSETSDGVGCYDDDKAPSRGDMGPHGTSDNGHSFDGPDAQEFVGISLVGNNFSKFYPNAYCKEEDDEN